MSSGRTPRLYTDKLLSEGREVELGQDAARYLGSVMRLGPGAEVLLFDDRTGEWRCEIGAINKRGVAAIPQVRIRPRETPPDIWLCAAPIRRQRYEWIAEKACELGAARLVPVRTAFTQERGIRSERLRAHMIEAAEQCERTALPELAATQSLAELLDSWPDERALIFCDETGGEKALAAMPGAPAAILIGPEGGFSPEERERIRSHPKAIGISLGPRILRADTAAVAALALWRELHGQ